MATILSRLGMEFFLCLHKENSKSSQKKKLEEDDEYVPISARQQFKLRSSRQLESDEDYVNLTEETDTLVEEFKKNLKQKILSVTTLEVKKLKESTLET